MGCESGEFGCGLSAALSCGAKKDGKVNTTVENKREKMGCISKVQPEKVVFQ